MWLKQSALYNKENYSSLYNLLGDSWYKFNCGVEGSIGADAYGNFKVAFDDLYIVWASMSGGAITVKCAKRMDYNFEEFSYSFTTTANTSSSCYYLTKAGDYWIIHGDMGGSYRGEIFYTKDPTQNNWTKYDTGMISVNCIKYINNTYYMGGYYSSSYTYMLTTSDISSNSWSKTLLKNNYGHMPDFALVNNKWVILWRNQNLQLLYGDTLSNSMTQVDFTQYKYNTINGKIFYSGGYYYIICYSQNSNVLFLTYSTNLSSWSEKIISSDTSSKYYYAYLENNNIYVITNQGGNIVRYNCTTPTSITSEILRYANTGLSFYYHDKLLYANNTVSYIPEVCVPQITTNNLDYEYFMKAK